MTKSTGLRPYSGGHFEMILDGSKTTSTLKSVDGGWPKQQIIDEPTGSELFHIKHGGIWDADPITIDFGIAGSYGIFKWIECSWKHESETRSGEIIHANFNKKQTLVQEFYDAHVLETTFPTLDGQSREPTNVKVKFQPEKVVMKKGDGSQLGIVAASKQKSWGASKFRLSLDGMSNLDKCNKIDSFTIKQGVKKAYYGQDRLAELIPTKIEFPNLVCYIAEPYADDLMKWHKENIAGKKENDGQITGSLEFLSSDFETMFTIKLSEVGLAQLQVVQATANEDKIKRVKFDLFVGRMELDGSKGAGFE